MMMMMSPLHKAACDPDVSATEYLRPSQLVDLIHQNTKSFGVFHPGYRAARLAHNVLNVLDNGEPPVKGKNATGFSWPEEVAAQRADAVPFSLQDALERRGCKYSVADKPFGTHVVTDGRLITGQNPASARAVGEAVVAALQER